MPIYEPKNQFSIEEHFKQYISVAFRGYEPEDLPPQQLECAKDAFFSSWSQAICAIRDHLPEDDDKAIRTLEDMIQQTITYWENKLKQQ